MQESLQSLSSPTVCPPREPSLCCQSPAAGGHTDTGHHRERAGDLQTKVDSKHKQNLLASSSTALECPIATSCTEITNH